MTSTLSGQFHKGPACPSSQTLFAYHHAGRHAHQSQRIERHLAACDFCNAELQLLTRHFDGQEEYFVAEMPAELRKLAERLLNHGVAPQTINGATPAARKA